MLLSKLVEALPNARVEGPLDKPVARICSDSRLVEPGSVFVALTGGQIQDRHQFVDDALARRGRDAVAIDADAGLGGGIP